MTTTTVAEPLQVPVIALTDAWLACQRAADEATNPADAARLYKLTADLMAMGRELALHVAPIDFAASADEDGGVSVYGSDDEGYSWPDGFDYEAEIREQSAYLGALATARRFAEQA